MNQQTINNLHTGLKNFQALMHQYQLNDHQKCDLALFYNDLKHNYWLIEKVETIIDYFSSSTPLDCKQLMNDYINQAEQIYRQLYFYLINEQLNDFATALTNTITFINFQPEQANLSFVKSIYNFAAIYDWIENDQVIEFQAVCKYQSKFINTAYTFHITLNPKHVNQFNQWFNLNYDRIINACLDFKIVKQRYTDDTISFQIDLYFNNLQTNPKVKIRCFRCDESRCFHSFKLDHDPYDPDQDCFYNQFELLALSSSDEQCLKLQLKDYYLDHPNWYWHQKEKRSNHFLIQPT